MSRVIQRVQQKLQASYIGDRDFRDIVDELQPIHVTEAFLKTTGIGASLYASIQEHKKHLKPKTVESVSSLLGAWKVAVQKDRLQKRSRGAAVISSAAADGSAPSGAAADERAAKRRRVAGGRDSPLGQPEPELLGGAELLSRLKELLVPPTRAQDSGGVPSLQELCISKARDNLESVADTRFPDRLSASAMLNLLSRATAKQLTRICRANAAVWGDMADIDILWQIHCQRDFPREYRRAGKPAAVSWASWYLTIQTERARELERGRKRLHDFRQADEALTARSKSSVVQTRVSKSFRQASFASLSSSASPARSSFGLGPAAATAAAAGSAEPSDPKARAYLRKVQERERLALQQTAKLARATPHSSEEHRLKKRAAASSGAVRSREGRKAAPPPKPKGLVAQMRSRLQKQRKLTQQQARPPRPQVVKPPSAKRMISKEEKQRRHDAFVREQRENARAAKAHGRKLAAAAASASAAAAAAAARPQQPGALRR